LVRRQAVDEHISEEALETLVAMVMVAGQEENTSQLTATVQEILERYRWQEFRQLWRTGDQSAMTEELMRYCSIIDKGIIRQATADSTVGGCPVRSGDYVVVDLMAANQDPALCPRPDALDLDRERTKHVAFGHGTHMCVGQNLARIVLRVGLTVLVERVADLRPSCAGVSAESTIRTVSGFRVRPTWLG
jgi:cytochrome P450